MSYKSTWLAPGIDVYKRQVHTVTTHRRNISNKLKIHTTAGLAIYAIANKLVNIEDIQVG